MDAVTTTAWAAAVSAFAACVSAGVAIALWRVTRAYTDSTNQNC